MSIKKQDGAVKLIGCTVVQLINVKSTLYLYVDKRASIFHSPNDIFRTGIIFP